VGLTYNKLSAFLVQAEAQLAAQKTQGE
jgi:hypothetical protein